MLRACGITQLLDAALAGFHVTVMTYGQTGSGKTFTMSGREDALEADDYAGESVVLDQAPCHAPPSSMYAEERQPLHMVLQKYQLCCHQGDGPPYPTAATRTRTHRQACYLECYVRVLSAQATATMG